MALLPTLASPAAAQAALRGVVRDSVTGEPIAEARVELGRQGTVLATAYSDGDGRFGFDDMPAGSYTLRVSRIDFQAHRLVRLRLAADETTVIVITLEPVALSLNPLIVSASRRAEKLLDAPASVSVLDREDVKAVPALAPADYAAGVMGMDVATTGITQHEVVARGFSNIASGSLLLLTDNRLASVPSLRINVDNFIPLTNDDIARIEFVRGPGAALYGPNSANGVMHIITRSPFDTPGVTASFTGGERSLLHGSVRYATVLDGVGVKLSGQYLRANDWPYVDPNEVLARDPTVRRASGEAQIAWRAATRTSMVGTVGVNLALRNVELTPLGAAQVDDWRYVYVQSRITSGTLFAQVYLNASDAGDTRLLRTGDAIKDRSLMAVAQVQNASPLGARATLTYGFDLQRTVPRTDNTITGRNEADDFINELGGYVHGEYRVSPAVSVVSAVRLDYHNRLDQPVFSPRAAIVWQATQSQTLRVTYNRAFSTPTTNDLFLDIVGATLPTPIPTTVRLSGVPKSGFSFRRDCGGLCMRSPYTPDALGGPTAYLPTDATLLWDVLVDTLAGRGFDLSLIPAPTATDVPSVLARADLSTGQFQPVSGVDDIAPLRPTISNVIEIGYRGTPGSRWSIGIDLYRAWRNDFISAERVETPAVLFDREALATYLGWYMPLDTAAFLAGVISTVPVGVVTPQEARDPWEILVTYRNFGRISYWGSDIEVSALVGRGVAVRANYSWTSADQFVVPIGGGGLDTIPLNAPDGRGSVTVSYRNAPWGLNADTRARFVKAFPMQSGVYRGTVDAYAVVDANVEWQFSRLPDLTLTVSVLNMLDYRHREFVGAPEIGRLVTGRVRVEF